MADILTAEQQAAVENRGRSLLVSAAAGSGKTKVLVERLFSYVESGEANLDDFLIITYTRAAAAELRGGVLIHAALRSEADRTVRLAAPGMPERRIMLKANRTWRWPVESSSFKGLAIHSETREVING